MSRQERDLDLVVFGATGFTGRLVAEFLLSEYGADNGTLRWALAGRNMAGLAEVRNRIGAPGHLPLIVADVDDADSMAALARSTRVVVTTVGPFAIYGEPLLRACIEAGTDYADLTGEPLWIREMIGKYADAAAASDARIAFCSGYDCIPTELGTYLLQRECQARFGRPAPVVLCRIGTFMGSPSGGSAATGKHFAALMERAPELRSVMADPFALTEGFRGPSLPNTTGAEQDEATGQWTAPSVMEFINSKIVHRSNLLRGFAYGEDFIYHESAMKGEGEDGRIAAEEALRQRPIDVNNMPKPGDGPSRDFCFSSRWDLLLIAQMPDGQDVRMQVKGKYDLGYASTARMLAETGIALLTCEAPGGLSLPGVLLGEALATRLREHAEVDFCLLN